MRKQGECEKIQDFIGVGFGPSNLAVAVAFDELAPHLKGLFLERNLEFRWHAGLLFDHSRMQISFLKDLVTLRNPASPFSFLMYTKAKGRLDRFVNLREFHPSRLEYQDYLRWVAGHFGEQVRFGTRVCSVVPRLDHEQSHFEVEVEDLRSGVRSIHRTRHVIVGTGGSPRVPERCHSDSGRIIHSSQFLPVFYSRFPNRQAATDFVVIGDGQSSGEIIFDLLQKYPNARVRALVAGYTLRPVDSTPFVNEVFSLSELNKFYHASASRKEAILRDLRFANYGAIDPELLTEIYRHAYFAEVQGKPRLQILPFSRLVGAQDHADRLMLTVQDRVTEITEEICCDGAVLATGYDRRLEPDVYGDTLPLLKRKEDGSVELSRRYRAETCEPMQCAVYLQGFAESSHGVGDTLLSQLPFRSVEIVEDILEQEQSRPSGSPEFGTDYPPRRHVTHDEDMLYAFLERYPFATLISAGQDADPVVTQAPLILDRERRVLFGHVDRANPHAKLLDNRKLVAVFHGPNCYISPHLYSSSQLPTWNSMSVHLWGFPRLLNHAAVVRGLLRISERTDPRPGAYRLAADDPRIDDLIGGIVGFELQIEEMIGRFKLSQDRDFEDRRSAAEELLRNSRQMDRDLIQRAVGLELTSRVQRP